MCIKFTAVIELDEQSLDDMLRIVSDIDTSEWKKLWNSICMYCFESAVDSADEISRHVISVPYCCTVIASRSITESVSSPLIKANRTSDNAVTTVEYTNESDPNRCNNV